jgi:TolA-binding protein
VLHDAFVGAFASIHTLEDPSALKPWLSRVAAFTARKVLRTRSRRAWLGLFRDTAHQERSEPVIQPNPEVFRAVRETYAVLDELPVDERMAFALRFIEGMELSEAAASCGVSLATAFSHASFETPDAQRANPGRVTMARPVTPLGLWGERVSTRLDQLKPERLRALGAARTELVRHLAQPFRPKRSWHRPVGVAACGLALAAGVLLWVLGRPPPRLEFTVDGSPGVLQAWLAGSEARPLEVGFSDGSSFKIGAGARARVVDVDHRGARIALERGELYAQVKSRSSGAWWVIAGPFTVRVTGTRFDLGWEPEAEKLSVAVTEGSVGVSGAIVGGDRRVRAGERLIVSVPLARIETLQPKRSDTAAEPAAQGATPDAIAIPQRRAPTLPVVASSRSALAPVSVLSGAGSPAVTSSATATPAANASHHAGATDSWQELARAGRLKEAFLAAEAQGFRGVCETASSSELLLLGDAARLAGRPDRASSALLDLRRRYPEDPRRAAAAFALGKVAFDQRGAYSQAAEWFSTCIREQPEGSLVREALGRLMEALHRAGDDQNARQTARQYLSRYPKGPHADAARSLLR